MHPNPVFRGPDAARNFAFAQARSFGTLAVNAPDGPLLSHIPFRISEDKTYLEAHLLRSNPIARMLGDGASAVMSVTGPDSYVSPDWYETEDQVPTWNYVAVHIRGRLRLLEQAELRGVIERLSEMMERQLLPKPIWKLDKLDEDTIAKMFRMIVPIRLEIDGIEGTWKVGQNKAAEAVAAASGHIEAAGIGMESSDIAQLMRAFLEDRD